MVRIRTAGNFQAVPAGCEYLKNVPFIFDAKLPLKGPNKLTFLRPTGKEVCFDNVRREEVRCDVEVVQFAFFRGRRFAEGASDVRAYVFASDKSL